MYSNGKSSLFTTRTIRLLTRSVSKEKRVKLRGESRDLVAGECRRAGDSENHIAIPGISSGDNRGSI
jgi:hypothetical protein